MAEVKEIIDLIEDGATKEDTELISKAFEFAKGAHEGQKRKSGKPYFRHVLETAKNLAKFGMDVQTIMAGLLHDVLEDTEVTEKEVEKEFGKDVLFLIKGVTKLGTLKYRGQERHVESLRKFFVAIAHDLRVVIIKFADRLHNLSTLEFLPKEKRERIAMESIEVYAPLANRIGMGHLKGQLEDAAFPYAYPEEFKQVEEVMKEKKDQHQENLSEVRKELEKILEKNKIKVVEIDYRVKHKYSLWKKLMKRDMDVGKIYDMVALRVIVKNVEECYRVLGLIHSIWKPLPGRIKDYIAAPKPNGYRSLHTTIFSTSGGIVEIQVKTEEMHEEAAYGIAAHFAYKEDGSRKAKSGKSKFRWIEELKNLHYTSDKKKGLLGKIKQELRYESKEADKFLEQIKTDFFSDRIFVFTPKGDVIDLPEDSCPIDFAYLIHTEIGSHISGAKINGKMSQIFSKLKNGDIVEIVNNKNAAPSSKWLECTKTSIAKKHIKSYLEKHSLLTKLKSFGQS